MFRTLSIDKTQWHRYS